MTVHYRRGGQWITVVSGIRGEKGEQGVQGIQGNPGKDGKDGAPGPEVLDVTNTFSNNILTTKVNDKVSTVTIPIPDISEKADKKYVDNKISLHTNDKSNPHNVTKTQVGLGNVDNTSDADKPVSTATQTALNTINGKLPPMQEQIDSKLNVSGWDVSDKGKALLIGDGGTVSPGTIITDVSWDDIKSKPSKFPPSTHTHQIPDVTHGIGTIRGGVFAMDTGKINNTRACRTAFLPPESVTIEYSEDGGATWHPYDCPDSRKAELTSMVNTNPYYLGGVRENPTGNTGVMLRVTYTAIEPWYMSADTCYMWISTSGGTVEAKIEKNTQAKPDVFTAIPYLGNEDGWFEVSGWGGPNEAVFGNSVFGRSVPSFRFTFRATSINTKYGNPTVTDIRLYGNAYYSGGNSMSKTDHIYAWDADQNVRFPAKGTFEGNLQAPTLSIGSWNDGFTVSDSGAYYRTKPIAVRDDLNLKMDKTGGVAEYSATPDAKQVRNIVYSESEPTGAVDGDIWIGNGIVSYHTGGKWKAVSYKVPEDKWEKLGEITSDGNEITREGFSLKAICFKFHKNPGITNTWYPIHIEVDGGVTSAYLPFSIKENVSLYCGAEFKFGCVETYQTPTITNLGTLNNVNQTSYDDKCTKRGSYFSGFTVGRSKHMEAGITFEVWGVKA